MGAGIDDEVVPKEMFSLSLGESQVLGSSIDGGFRVTRYTSRQYDPCRARIPHGSLLRPTGYGE